MKLNDENYLNLFNRFLPIVFSHIRYLKMLYGVFFEYAYLNKLTPIKYELINLKGVLKYLIK